MEPNSWFQVAKAHKQKCDGCSVTDTIAIEFKQATEDPKQPKRLAIWIVCRYHYAMLLSRMQLVMNYEAVKTLWANGASSNGR